MLEMSNKHHKDDSCEKMKGSAEQTEHRRGAGEKSASITENTQRQRDREAETERGGGAGKMDDRRRSQSKESWRERRKKSRDVEVPDDGVPYDRGWAWMIVLAGFMNFVVAAGYNRATFIFFVEFLEQFQAPVTETALLFGVKAATNSLVGLFVMNAVVGRFGVRKTVFVGGVCISLSAILGSFANDITSLILCQSLFHGLGMAALNMPTTVLLGYYFRRRRSLANSLTKCGVGAGAVTFPPITTFLLRQYGVKGALLVIGGLCLHTLVAAFLLRPVSLYKKRRQLLVECSTPLLLTSTQAADDNDTGNGDDDDSARVKQDTRSSTHDENEANDDDENADLQTRKCTLDEDKANGDDDVRATNTRSGTHDEGKSNHDADDGPLTRNTCDEKNGHLQTRKTTGNRFGVGADSQGFITSQNGCVVVIEQEVRPSSCSSSGHQTALALPPFLSRGLLDDLSKSVPDVSHNSGQERFRRRTNSCSKTNNRITVGVSPPHRSGVISGHVLEALSQSKVVRYMSAPDLELDTPCVVTAADAHAKNTPPSDQPSPRACQGVRWCVGAVVGVLDFSLFHSPMFRLLAVYFFTSPLTQAVTTYLPAMATERGLDQQHTAMLLSIIGGLDFACRLACGFLADLKIVKVSTMIGVAFIVVGVVCQLTRLLTSFPLLIGLAVTQGLFGGVGACLLPILIMEDLGLENTAKALGFAKLLSGAAMAVAHPFLGYLRDVTGGYDVAYHVMGAFTLLSAVVILSLRLLPHLPPPTQERRVL